MKQARPRTKQTAPKGGGDPYCQEIVYATRRKADPGRRCSLYWREEYGGRRLCAKHAREARRLDAALADARRAREAEEQEHPPARVLEFQPRRGAFAGNVADVIYDLLKDNPRVDRARLERWREEAFEFFNSPAPCPRACGGHLCRTVDEAFIFCSNHPRCEYFEALGEVVLAGGEG